MFLSSRFTLRRGISDGLASFLDVPVLREKISSEESCNIKNSTIALVTTAGFFIKGQLPFKENTWSGDSAFRILHRDISLKRFTLGNHLIDRRLPLLDPNMLHPIDRLKELKAEGVIKGVSENHYSFCPFSTRLRSLVSGSARDVARRLHYEGVDKAIVYTSSVLSQEMALLIQHVIEEEGIPTVSLTYTQRAIDRMKPARTVLFGEGSLFRLEKFMEARLQRDLLIQMMNKFETS